MHLVVLVEERSMKIVLDHLIPAIVPGVEFQVVPFQGKGDLKNGIPIKLRGWNKPGARFAIVRDQDRADCKAVKAEIAAEVEKTGKSALIRIACHELEAWYFGDLIAVSLAYGEDYTGLSAKRKYRDPDDIADVKERFLEIIPEHQQIKGARLIAPHMDIGRNTSRSFQALVSGLRRLCS